MHWLDRNTVYEDNHLLIIDKPSGLLTQGDQTGDTNLFDLVKDHLKHKYNKPGNVYLALVNRLDRPVGGLVLLAKTSKAAERLHSMMQQHQFDKEYLVLCHGHPPENHAALEHYLLKDESTNKTKVYPNPHKAAKKCILHYELLAHMDGLSLLSIQLQTGRSHQIRAQLAYINCPILGDNKYGKSKTGSESDLYLFAYRLQFIHPVSKEPVIAVTFPSDKREWKHFQSFFPKI